MTGTAASVYAKVVTTLGSRLRSRAMVTIAALLGVAGLVLWPVAALPVAEADQGSGTLPLAQSAGLSAEIAPAAPAAVAKPSATSASTTATPSAPAEKDKTTNQVTVSIDAMAPEVLHSDQDLNLTGTITNGTAQTITGADLVTRVQRSTEATSRGLSKWLTGTDESGLSDPFTVPLGHDLQPGGVSQFSITIPADELPLVSTDQWGPRGVSVALATQDVSLAQDRSILVWDSGTSVAPVRMTVFLPVTASAQEMAVLSAPHTQERTEALSRIHNRVLGLVSMAGDGVVVAVDPALIEALGVTTASLEQAARNSSSQPSTPDASPQAPQSADSSASSAPTAPSTPAPSASTATSPQAGAPRRRHRTRRRLKSPTRSSSSPRLSHEPSTPTASWLCHGATPTPRPWRTCSRRASSRPPHGAPRSRPSSRWGPRRRCPGWPPASRTPPRSMRWRSRIRPSSPHRSPCLRPTTSPTPPPVWAPPGTTRS
ncbi:conserved domain protein [Actinomyces sp. oral taxon 175 str. F0384]|nr:conserved domain protein [Actinomyces sp. oral taxon 175 str. F0384]